MKPMTGMQITAAHSANDVPCDGLLPGQSLQFSAH